MTVPAPNNASGTETTHYYYDTNERLDEIEWPDSSTIHVGYNSDDYPTTYENELSNTWTTAYDVLNRATSVTDPASGVVSTTYSKAGDVLTTENQLGDVTTNVWNSRHELVEQDLPDPDGSGPLSAPALYYTYSATGKELTYTDGLGRETQYSYNDLDEMTEETLPPQTTGGTSPTIQVGYDNLQRKTSETSPLSAVTTWAYGNTDISQVTTITAPDPDGSGPLSAPVTTLGYDSDGRNNTVEDAMSHTTTTAFTVDGEEASVEDNLSHTTSYSYGHGGELLETTDALSHSTSDEYDSRYRLVQVTDANSGVTQITLDAAGNETKLVDSDSNETDWTFNSRNLPVTETNSLGTTTTSYDAASQITSIEDADGRVRDFTHDNLGRLTEEDWMSGSTVVASMDYGYDAANELTSASDSNSDYAFAYNGDGQVTSTDNYGTPNIPHVVLSAGYDLAGDMTSQSATIAGTADFLNNYSYDADQRLTTVQQEQQTGGNTVAPKEIDYAYNALGQFTSIAYYNTLSGPRTDVATGAFMYDSGNRLTGLAYTSDGGANTLDTFGWGYNAGNLVTSFSSIDGTASYGYDSTNQLTSASYTTSSGGHQPANESFSYTANGNRDSTGYSTGDDNLITSDGTFNYTHDADGNTTSRTRISSSYATDYLTTYTWDYRNRLTDVDYYDNNSVLTKHIHYTYDVLNNLIATQVDSTGSGSYNITQRYVVEGGQPVLEFDGSGDLIGRNLIAPNPAGVDVVMAQGVVSSTSSADVVTWMIDDKLGSTRDVVNNSGSVVNHEVYSAFGQDVYESNSAYTHWTGFGSGHDDVYTGLNQNGRRWDNPATSKWLSNDPIDFRGGDTDLSRSDRNSPTNLNDPSGLAPNLGNAMGGAAAGMIGVQAGMAAAEQATAGLGEMAAVAAAAAMGGHAGIMMAQQQAIQAQQAAAAQQGAANMLAMQQGMFGPQQAAAAQGQQAAAAAAQNMIANQGALVQPQIVVGAVAPAPPAGPPMPPGGGLNAGMLGGATAGSGIGVVMGGLGATVVVVGWAFAMGTPIGWAGVGAIAIGAGLGLLFGAASGALAGNGAPNFAAGAGAAASNGWVWGGSFIVGAAAGFWQGTPMPPILPPPPAVVL